jgi:hypothetical protein
VAVLLLCGGVVLFTVGGAKVSKTPCRPLAPPYSLHRAY